LDALGTRRRADQASEQDRRRCCAHQSLQRQLLPNAPILRIWSSQHPRNQTLS
jgi:hypothetical protein